MRRTALRAAVAFCALALAGCGLSERPYLARRDWPLTVNRPTAIPPRRGGRVLLVRGVEAGPGIESRGLQTLGPDGSLDVSFYEEWAALPAEGVESDLRNWLEQSGLFAAVVVPGSQASPDLVLEARLAALIADPGAHEARATMSVLLIRQGLLSSQVLKEAVLTGRATLPDRADVPAKVAAMKAAVADLLAQVEKTVQPFAGTSTTAPAPHARRRS